MVALDPFLAGTPAPFTVPSPAPDPSPRPRLVLSLPPWLPHLARFVWRATTSFLFTVARSVASLATVAVSCAMAERSLAVAVAKFAMVYTVSCWRYPLSRFAVALCAAL